MALNAQSPALAKLEKEFTQNGGQWCEFSLKDLFEVNSSKEIFHANQIKEIHAQEKENTYPYVVRSTLNNGIRGYIAQDKECLNPANTLSFAQDTFSVFYQEKPYFTGNKVKILVPKFTGFNKKLALFIVSIYQKVLAHLTWGTGSTTQSIQDIKIQLPAHKNGEIAFDFMQSYIAELEAERIAELEAYLQATGLKDYELNEDEKAALKAFESLENSHQKSPSPCGFGGGLFNENLKWREFKIGELFECIQQGARLKQADHIKGDLPFVMSGVVNTGISGFIGNANARKFTANALTIDIFGSVFYRGYDFGASDDVGVFWNEKRQIDPKAMLFLCASISRAFAGKFDFGHKLRASRAGSFSTFLPTKNGEIDFDFMRVFIKAIEKEVIKGVVLYSTKRLTATKQIISKPQTQEKTKKQNKA